MRRVTRRSSGSEEEPRLAERSRRRCRQWLKIEAGLLPSAQLLLCLKTRCPFCPGKQENAGGSHLPWIYCHTSLPSLVNAEEKLEDAREEEEERGLSAVRGRKNIHMLSLMGLRHLERVFPFLFF